MSNAYQALVWKIPMPNSSDKSVLAKLADNANDEGVCHPAWKRIEREASVSPATLSEILNALECYGTITRNKRKRKNGANSSNSYTLHIPEFSKLEISEYWEDKESKDSKNDGVVASYVEGYASIRKALMVAKQAKSVGLFLSCHAKHKVDGNEKDFVLSWNELMLSQKAKKFGSPKAKSEYLKALFERTFNNHTSHDEVAHTSHDEVAHTSHDEVAHTSHGEVAHTSHGEVAHTSHDEVATIFNHHTFNHHSFITQEKTKDKFSFGLTKNSQYENLTAEYKEQLKKYADEKDEAVHFENFLNFHGSKGSVFKNWSMAYNTWCANAEKFAKNKRGGNEADATIIAKSAKEMIIEGKW